MTKEEAIRRIKLWNLDSDDMEVLSVVVPELAESKDEGIRKAIMEVLKRVSGATDVLENQGTTFKKAMIWLEKQKEQEPAEWSKEDEEMRISILQEIANIKDVFPKINIQPEFDWLKSLPLNLKKKNEDVSKLCSNEWSEKDEIMLNAAIEMVENSNTVFCFDVNNCKVSSWLKSLRPPQYCENCKLKRSVENWKPSEEQMKEYAYWYKNFIESGLASPSSKAVTVLGDLLEQLQKL